MIDGPIFARRRRPPVARWLQEASVWVPLVNGELATGNVQFAVSGELDSCHHSEHALTRMSASEGHFPRGDVDTQSVCFRALCLEIADLPTPDRHGIERVPVPRV